MKYLFSSGIIVSLLLIKNVDASRWLPPQGATWNYVLEGKLDMYVKKYFIFILIYDH